jgi:CheY-like chemotaxis protein
VDRNILVVDDDASIRDSLGDVLRDEGYTVMTAANGRDALTHLQQNRESPPALILLDLMMPVMDGLSFLDSYGQDASLPSVPVVVMSANIASTGGHHRKDILLYMKKPLDIDRLLETVGVWCG